jgi:uncharacterized repeat protein (TIGR03803 family)
MASIYFHCCFCGGKMKILWFLPAFLFCLCDFSLGQSTETVLYSFGAYPTDGSFPQGGLLFDSVGNIYGTTNGGGEYCQNDGGCGAVYELSPSPGGWTETILYSFCSAGLPTCTDGSTPYAGLIMDGLGDLYGTTTFGGTEQAGTVFRMSPPSSVNGNWTHTVLWSFGPSKMNGNSPAYGKLNMDSAGNIYGTTMNGGIKDFGTVFELSPQIDGTYSFSVLHSFSGKDGVSPEYGVAIDGGGNLYGTTENGGIYNSSCEQGCGIIYELSPSNGTWQYTSLYKFNGVAGQNPVSPISIDQYGNLYGTFEVGGGGICFFGTCGGIFKLVPGSGGPGKKYTFYFDGGQAAGNPQNGVLVGADNTIYGTVGVLGRGNVYELKYNKETILYNFCSLPNCADGSGPDYGTIVTRQGSLYGATFEGGLYGVGVVYAIAH